MLLTPLPRKKKHSIFLCLTLFLVLVASIFSLHFGYLLIIPLFALSYFFGAVLEEYIPGGALVVRFLQYLLEKIFHPTIWPLTLFVADFLFVYFAIIIVYKVSHAVFPRLGIVKIKKKSQK